MTVRFFFVFAAIFAVTLVVFDLPLLLHSKDAPDNFVKYFGRWMGGTPVTTHEVKPSPPSILYNLLYFAELFLEQVPAGAMIVVSSAVYLGGETSFTSAYRAAFARFRGLMAVTLLFGLTLFGLLVPATILIVVASIVTAIFSRAAASVAGLTLTFGLAIFVLPILVLSVQLAYRALLLEGLGARASYARSLRRVFSKQNFGRSVLAAFAYCGLFVAMVLFFMAERHLFLFGTVHSQFLTFALSFLGRIIHAVLGTAFLTVFYYDIRARDDAFDLTINARMATSEPENTVA